MDAATMAARVFREHFRCQLGASLEKWEGEIPSVAGLFAHENRGNFDGHRVVALTACNVEVRLAAEHCTLVITVQQESRDMPDPIRLDPPLAEEVDETGVKLRICNGLADFE